MTLRITASGYCPRCGEPMERESDHNCGRVTITKDRLRTLEEIEQRVTASTETRGGA